MRHFIFFISAVFAGLAFFYYSKDDKTKLNEDRTVRVYIPTLLASKSGAISQLKEIFEKQTMYKVDFIETQDLSMFIQKMNFENQNSFVDVVMGFDQFELNRSIKKMKWRKLPKDFLEGVPSQIIKQNEAIKNQNEFVPYSWVPISFLVRRDSGFEIAQIDDLLKSETKGKVTLQDPRINSTGLFFLSWIFQLKTEPEATQFLRQLSKQNFNFSSSWSASYQLLKTKQLSTAFVPITLSIFSKVDNQEEGLLNSEVKEPLPVQLDFAGIPEVCKNCEGAQRFLEFLLSPEAQKIIMMKNYVFPVLDRVKEATLFDTLKVYKTLPVEIYEQEKIEKWINQWVELKKN